MRILMISMLMVALGQVCSSQFVSADIAAGLKRSTKLQQSGRLAESESMLKRLLARPDNSPLETALIFNELGLAFQTRDAYSQAEHAYMRSIELFLNSREDQLLLNRARMNLATLYIETNQGKKARMAMSQVREDALQEPIDQSHYRSLTAALAMLRNDLEEAAQRYRVHLQLLQAEAAGNMTPEIATTLNNLGSLEVRRGKWAEALPWITQAVSAFRSIQSPNDPALMKALANLGHTQARLGDYERARMALAESLTIANGQLGEEHPLTVSIGDGYAEALFKTGRRQEAKLVKQGADRGRTRIGRTSVVDVTDFRTYRDAGLAEKTETSKKTREQ